MHFIMYCCRGQLSDNRGNVSRHSFLVPIPKLFPSFDPNGLDSLKVSRKPHPLVSPRTPLPGFQGLISLEHHIGKQRKSVHAVDSALLLLLLSLLSDVSLLNRVVIKIIS